MPKCSACDGRSGVEHHGDRHLATARNLTETAGDGVKALAPALPPMAGDEQPIRVSASLAGLRKQRNALQQRVDAAVARDHDLPACALPTEVRCVELSRREQQVGFGVNGDSKILLGPWVRPVVAAEPRLDMRHRHACHGRSQSSTKGARRIALNDDELRSVDCRTDASGHLSHMPVRVRLPRAAKLRRRKACEVKHCGFEVRMLAREDDPREGPAIRERSCYRRKLDGFRTRTDDERNTLI